MRKILLILAAFFVLSTSQSFAIYSVDGPQPTPGEDGAMLMTATTDAVEDKVKSRAMEAKDAMKSAIKEGREAFKEKMKSIKDTKKAKIVENLDLRVNEMNKKKTTMLTERLDRLTTILGKISSRAATLKATANTAAIADATQAIEAAKTAVATQAAKDYVVDVTTETALKTDARAVIKEFIADIKAVMEKVRLAQVAVAKAHKLAVPSPSPTEVVEE